MYKLYLIGDKKYSFEKTRTILEIGRIDYFQLRLKGVSNQKFLDEAYRYKEICDKNNIKFIINDNLEVALKVRSDGIHIGQDDIPFKEVKRVFDGIVGISTHNINEAKEAKELGADYIGFGSIYPTNTKKDANVVGVAALCEVCKIEDLNVCAIGGIDEKNFKELISCKPKFIAISSAILGSSDPKTVIKKLRSF